MPEQRTLVLQTLSLGAWLVTSGETSQCSPGLLRRNCLELAVTSAAIMGVILTPLRSLVQVLSNLHAAHPVHVYSEASPSEFTETDSQCCSLRPWLGVVMDRPGP